MSVPVNIARAQASARLVKAIDDLARSGMLPHCADRRTSHLWLSDHLEDRAQAVKLCHGCPIFTESGEAASARREQFASGRA